MKLHFSKQLSLPRLILALVSLAGSLILPGCNQLLEEASVALGIRDSIHSFLADSLLDTLTKYGVKINDGDKPPQLSGNYFANSRIRIDGNIPNDKNDSFVNESFQFYEQSGQRIKIKSKESSTTSISDSAFVSGSGNHFTIFAQENGSYLGNAYNIEYKAVTTISGTLTNKGITDYITSIIITEKSSDPDDYLIDVGFGRTITEKDGLVESVSDFPHAAALTKKTTSLTH